MKFGYLPWNQRLTIRVFSFFAKLKPSVYMCERVRCSFCIVCLSIANLKDNRIERVCTQWFQCLLLSFFLCVCVFLLLFCLFVCCFVVALFVFVVAAFIFRLVLKIISLRP